MLIALVALSAAATEPDVPEAAPEEAAPEEAAPGEAAPEPVVIAIDPVEEALPSALDTLAGAAAETAAEGGPGALGGLGSLVRGRWSVHPAVGYLSLPKDAGGSAVSLGGALAHQLWTLDALPVQLALASRLEVTAPVGGARGHRIEARTALGPWLGPVGLSAGPTLRWDRQRWSGGAELPSALLLGLTVGASLELGPLRPHIAVEPAGIVAGDRARARRGGDTLPVLLDETAWCADLRWVSRSFQLGTGATLRETAVGTAFEIGLSLHLPVL